MYKHILVLFQICQHWLVLGIVDMNHLDWTENLNQSYKNGLYKWEYDSNAWLSSVVGPLLRHHMTCKIQTSIINQIDSVGTLTVFTFIKIKYTFGPEKKLLSRHAR